MKITSSTSITSMSGTMSISATGAAPVLLSKEAKAMDAGVLSAQTALALGLAQGQQAVQFEGN